MSLSTLDGPEIEAASLQLRAMATFRDGELSRRQIGAQLGAAEADFARCLAMSGWALAKPLRLLAFGLPMHATLEDCLLERLRDAGRPHASLDDAVLAPCLDSRWEFVRGGDRPARYRPGPSYHERLRLELLLAAWERMTKRAGTDTLDAIATKLAAASAALPAHLILPLALLRRAGEESRRDAEADERLRRQVQKGLLDIAEDDLRHLAIANALDGEGDLVGAIARHGTPTMRVLLRAHLERIATTGARATLRPRIARLRRELWEPLAAG